ncbi:MAG: lipocalin family protein [Betaproteobacteria bacterium]|nr:lipocalin family protein [Betaproteobacteria bacterium]
MNPIDESALPAHDQRPGGLAGGSPALAASATGRAARGPLARACALLLLTGLGACASPPAATDPAGAALPPVRAVAAVDLDRYRGRWYEIAAYPMFFQRQCQGDTTAEYTPTPDGELTVLNRCRSAEGFAQARGRAWAVSGSGNARLKVSFFWPFRADYWVIGLDEDYRWAVVGEPGRRYLWVLSRTPELPPAQLERALSAARAQGYRLEPLVYTRQGPGSAPPR